MEVIELLSSSDDDEEHDSQRKKRRKVPSHPHSPIIIDLTSSTPATVTTPHSDNTTAIPNLPIHHLLTCNNPHLRYIQQHDKWSCGYRNLQMLLNSLLPILPPIHPLLSSLRNTIPSIHQIQSQIEQSWNQGFDLKGANHYNSRIRNTNSQIGAVEVASYLHFLYVDCTVVQFTKHRQLFLGQFLWSYYVSSDCQTTLSTSSSFQTSVRILQSLSETEIIDTTTAPIKDKVLLPIYLQWNGHSVTIIGIEYHPPDEFHLLIFDPRKPPPLSKKRKRCSTGYAVTLPVETLRNEDVQLIVCSTNPLKESERETSKKVVRHVLADRYC